MLELMKMQKRTGKYTNEQIAEQEAILLSLQSYKAASPNTPIPTPPKTFEPQFEKKPIVELSDDVQLLVDKIKEEMNVIDDEKNRLANEMTDIPDNVNCAGTVAKIKALRKEWQAKSDLFWYVRTHGEMPEVQSVEKPTFLPSDKHELHKMLLLARPRLSKYRKGLQTSKTDVKKLHYQKLIRIEENLIEEIETKMSVL